MKDSKKDTLKTLLKDCSLNNIVFFCGAGISYDYPTSIPTVYHFIKSIIKETVQDDKERERLLSLFIDCTYHPRFEVMVDEIITLHDIKNHIANIFYSENYNKNHYGIGKLIEGGASVITTNFDCCIENSLEQTNYNLIAFDGNDLPIDIVPVNSSIIKPHGSHFKSQFSDQIIISISALAKLNDGFKSLTNWREFLLKSMENKTIIFLGYSGSDDFDLTPIILESKYKNIIWLEYDNKVNSPIKIKNEKDNNHFTHKLSKIVFYKGLPIHIIQMLYQNTLHETKSNNQKEKDSVKHYIDKCYPSYINKRELLSTVLLQYNFPDEILNLDNEDFSNIIFLNKIRSLYIKGNHDQICDELNRIEYLNFPYEQSSKLLHIHSTAEFYLDNYDKSKDLAIIFYQKSKSNSDYYSQMQSLIQLGAIEYNIGNHKESRGYYFDALAIHEYHFPNIEAAAKCYWGIATLYHVGNDYDKAEEYNLKALDQYIKLGNNVSIAYISHNLGLLYLVKQNFDKAKEFLYLSESIFMNNKENFHYGQPGVIYSQLSLAKMYYLTNEVNLFHNKISKAYNTLKSCIGHPNFFQILVIYLYSIAKCESIPALKKEISEIHKSEFIKVIKERKNEIIITGENKAKELLYDFLNEKDENYHNQLVQFEKIFKEYFLN